MEHKKTVRKSEVAIFAVKSKIYTQAIEDLEVEVNNFLFAVAEEDDNTIIKDIRYATAYDELTEGNVFSVLIFHEYDYDYILEGEEEDDDPFDQMAAL